VGFPRGETKCNPCEEKGSFGTGNETTSAASSLRHCHEVTAGTTARRSTGLWVDFVAR
jgi:hypothetical protein